MTKRRKKSSRRPPRSQPLDRFLYDVGSMLETVASTAVFSGGAILLGRLLGTPPPPLQLPPGLPPEVVAEWERILGKGTAPAARQRKRETPGAESPDEPPAASPKTPPPPVQLVKGPDGIYRPED